MRYNFSGKYLAEGVGFLGLDFGGYFVGKEWCVLLRWRIVLLSSNKPLQRGGSAVTAKNMSTDYLKKVTKMFKACFKMACARAKRIERRYFLKPRQTQLVQRHFLFCCAGDSYFFA